MKITEDKLYSDIILSLIIFYLLLLIVLNYFSVISFLFHRIPISLHTRHAILDFTIGEIHREIEGIIPLDFRVREGEEKKNLSDDSEFSSDEI